MKISKSQLRKLVEAQLTVTPEDVAKAKDELGKEGGAAGPEAIAKIIDPEEEFDPEAVVTALMAADDDIKQSERGDLVDMSTMVAENSLTRNTLRKLILQEMYHSRRDAGFSRAQARYDAMLPPDDFEPEKPSADAPDEEVIDTLIENDYLETMIEEIAEEDTPHLIWSEAAMTYTDNKGNLIAKYVKEKVPSGRVYDILSIVDEDAAEDIVREYYLSEGIPERFYDAFDEIVIDNRNMY